MFTNDIVTHYAGKDRFSDRAQIWIARMFVIAIVAVTFVLSLNLDRSVFTMAIWCFSGFAALFPVVFAALYWRRLTAAGALAGILTMLGTWVYLFYQSEWGADTEFVLDFFGKDFPIMPVVAIFICTSVSMVSTSLMTRPPGDATLAKFFDD